MNDTLAFSLSESVGRVPHRQADTIRRTYEYLQELGARSIGRQMETSTSKFDRKKVALFINNQDDSKTVRAPDPFLEFADRVPNAASLRALAKNDDDLPTFATFEEYLAFVETL